MALCRRLAWLGVTLALGLVVSCASEEVPPAPVQIQTLRVRLLDEVIVAGGALRLGWSRGGVLVPTGATVTLRGELDGQPWRRTAPAVLSDCCLTTPWAMLAPPTTREDQFFQGDILIEVEDLSPELRGEGALLGAQILWSRTLVPQLSSPGKVEVHLYEDLSLPLSYGLRTQEGSTWLALDGTWTPEGQDQRAVSLEIPVLSVSEDRRTAKVRWSASYLGGRPGHFEGTALPRNRHLDRTTREGAAVALDLTLAPSALLDLSPTSASRGSIIVATGAGFLPPMGAEGYTMFFSLSGEFVPDDGIPERWEQVTWVSKLVFDHTDAHFVLRTEIENSPLGPFLTGPWSRPGTFTGVVTPVLLGPEGELPGVPYQGSLRVALTRQVVKLRFLPGYEQALQNFGLRNAEADIRARVFALLEALFEGVNVSFTDQTPEGLAEFTTIEVGGEDPNGAGLLGLDNTEGKDNGNLRLHETIGGQNPNSAEAGRFAFGGVFVDSFTLFSPTLSPQELLADPRFDEIFSPFMPALGGTPLSATAETRQDQRQRAVEALANLIAHTVGHELGHALGLAFDGRPGADPDQIHNEGDAPGALMDEGRYRPFAERAALPGAREVQLSTPNRLYLEDILPVP